MFWILQKRAIDTSSITDSTHRRTDPLAHPIILSLHITHVCSTDSRLFRETRSIAYSRYIAYNHLHSSPQKRASHLSYYRHQITIAISYQTATKQRSKPEAKAQEKSSSHEGYKCRSYRLRRKHAIFGITTSTPNLRFRSPFRNSSSFPSSCSSPCPYAPQAWSAPPSSCALPRLSAETSASCSPPHECCPSSHARSPWP